MKAKMLSMLLVVMLIVSVLSLPSFAYSRFGEDINFNKTITGSWYSGVSRYGSFSDYDEGYPTGGFYGFILASPDRNGEGNSLKISRTQQYNNQKIPGVRYTPVQTLTGVLYLETSMYIPATEKTLYSPRGITMRTASDTVHTLVQFTEAGGRFYLWDGAKILLTDAADPKWEPDTWYDIKIWYDLVNNDIKHYIVDEDGNVIVNKTYNGAENESISSGVESFGFINAWNFKKLYDEINTKKNDYSPTDVTHFDNIKIQTVDAMPSETGNSYVADFEGFSASAIQWALPAKPSGAEWTYTQYVGGGTVDGFMSADAGRGTSLKLVTGSETTINPYLDLVLGSPADVVSGKMSVQVPDKIIAKPIPLMLSSGNEVTIALFYDDGTLRVFGNNLGTYKLNTWYDIEYSYDATNGTYFYKVSEGENEYIGYGTFEQTGGFPQTVAKKRIRLNNAKAKKDSYILLDDIIFKAVNNDFRLDRDISTNNDAVSDEETIYARFTKKLKETPESLKEKVFEYYGNAEITAISLLDEYTIKLEFEKEVGKNYRIDFRNILATDESTTSDFIEFSTRPPEYITPVFTFTDTDGNKIENITKGSMVNMSTVLKTGTQGDKGAFAFLAVYDENRTLCDIDVKVTSFTEEGNTEDLSVLVPDTASTYRLVAMVMKRDLTPLNKEVLTTPVVIFKLDDLRNYSYEHFLNMTEFAEEQDIKIGVGIIANTLESASQNYIDAVKTIDGSPNAEIWCHGYTHQYTYTDGTLTYAEFTDTVENQSQTLKNSADILREKCGITVRSLGTPGNYSNSDTIKALEENPQYKTLLASASVGTLLEGKTYIHLTNWMNMESSVDVLKSLDALKTNYETSAKRAPYVLVAGHSYGWDDTSRETFESFVSWLKSKDVTFMTPTEYYNFVS